MIHDVKMKRNRLFVRYGNVDELLQKFKKQQKIKEKEYPMTFFVS